MDDGGPTGEVTMWDEIYFPFDPSLQALADLKSLAVAHSSAASAQRIEELYECDAGGVISVTISNASTGSSSTFRLGRWSSNVAQSVKASGRKKKQSASAR